MIEYENLKKLNEIFFDDFKSAFAEFIESGWYILGKQVRTFEQEFADFCGSKYCAGVASGLDALTLSLAALDLPKGSEIIVPSNTYIATILAIVENGLVPILVEPDIKTYNINPDLIAKAITSKTKVIMVVHLYGKSCEMDRINDLAKANNLFVIEDCAQAHGAKFKGQMIGTFGDFGAFSYYPTKNLGALGDAGAITSKTEAHDKKLKTLRNYGSQVKYHNQLVGKNSRLDEVQAALLSIKLKKLNQINDHKRQLAQIYLAGLKSDFVKPTVHSDYFDVYHIFNIRHPERNRLKDYLMKNEIMTEIHYPISPNKQEAMKGILDHFSTPIAEEIHQTTLSLPISFFHTPKDIERVVKVLNDF